MKTVTSVKEVMHLVATFEGEPTQFQLLIPDALNNSLGLNMSIITDHVVARDCKPDGFTHKDGYRIYRYAHLD